MNAPTKTTSAAAAHPAMVRVERPPRPSALSNALVFGWRAVLKFKHVPEQLFDLVMTPIMFTLLFTFVFGGALAGSTGAYLQYLPAGHPGADRLSSTRSTPAWAFPPTSPRACSTASARCRSGRCRRSRG